MKEVMDQAEVPHPPLLGEQVMVALDPDPTKIQAKLMGMGKSPA